MLSQQTILKYGVKLQVTSTFMVKTDINNKQVGVRTGG